MKKIILCSLVAMMAVTAANAEIASVEYVGNTAELKTEKKDDFTVAINELVDSVAQKDEQVAAANLDKFVPTLDRAQKMIDDSQSELSAIIGDTEDFQDGESVMGFVDANTDAIAAINNAETGILKKAQDYADANDADTIYDDTQVKQDIATNAGNITKNTDAIAAINNAETGILKKAQDYADANDADTIYDDTLVKEDIATNAGNITKNTEAIALINDDEKGILATAEKTYQGKSKANYVVGMADGSWQSIGEYYAGLPEYCSTGTCSLVSKEGVISWEKVAY